MARLLLLLPSTSYQTKDFMAAAHRLGVEITIGSDTKSVLAGLSDTSTIELNFATPDHAIAQIIDFHKQHPVTAIVAVDDVTSLVAAKASAELGLPHSDPKAVMATGNKLLLREHLAKEDLPSPRFKVLSTRDDPNLFADKVEFPCVLKPLNLSASRGVIRANDSKEFLDAVKRIKKLLNSIGESARQNILIEDYIKGEEVALEGLMVDGKLTALALFDKPDPLTGPYFEETIYVTPSRKSMEVQDSIRRLAEQAANAIGLTEGPIHAEVRVDENNDAKNDAGPWVIEIAARSIGGLCSRSLKFGDDFSLEDIILRHATGASILTERETLASGVMMIPIPCAGTLKQINGTLAAQSVRGITEVTINIAIGQEVVPLPEGNKYLGFIFAKGDTPEEVENTLRSAHGKLSFEIN